MLEATEQMVTKEELQQLARDTAREAVNEVFTRLGMDIKNPTEMQKDFIYLRGWRTSVESVKRQGMLSVIASFVAGVFGLLWWSVKHPH